MLAFSALPFIGGLCALSVIGLVLIVVAPSRRIREESRLDEEVQARLLLGEDPDQIDRELSGRASDPAPVADLHPDD
jgi:hypothetical protein